MREPATNASSNSQSMIAIERGSRICSTGAAKYTTRLETRHATEAPRTSVHMSRVET